MIENIELCLCSLKIINEVLNKHKKFKNISKQLNDYIVFYNTLKNMNDKSNIIKLPICDLDVIVDDFQEYLINGIWDTKKIKLQKEIINEYSRLIFVQKIHNVIISTLIDSNKCVFV